MKVENEEATGSQETGHTDAGDAAGTEGAEKQGSLSLSVEEAAKALLEMEGETGAGGKSEETIEREEAEGKQEKPDDRTTDEVKKEKVVFTPEQQAVLETRIGKEVAKTKAMEERLGKIQEELDKNRRARESDGGGAVPIFEMTAQELDALEEKAERMVEFAEEHWDGVPDAKDPETMKHTPESIRAAHRTYSKMLRQIPEARKASAERGDVERAVSQLYPELAEGGARAQEFHQFAKMMGPEFRKLPNAKVIFAHALLGEQLERARMAKMQDTGRRSVKAGEEREEPPRLPVGSRSGRKAGTATQETGTAGKKELNLKRLVDSGGSFRTAVEVLEEAGF